MKKNTNPTDRKRTFAICDLPAFCIAVLAGTYFLTRKPETEFIPAPVKHADMTRSLLRRTFIRIPMENMI